MAVRYSAEVLLHLRESPLCTKPSNLPAPDEWMGPLPENPRTANKPTTDRRTQDNPLLDSTNRRPGLESRHVSRNSANPEDIILGPPRTAFASATLRNTNTAKAYENEKGIKDPDPRNRFDFRNRNGEAEGTDRIQNPRANAFRRRGDADQDTEGWSTVKPRKSFGHEGAERFHGRMGGGGVDRFPNDRRPREKEEREAPRDRRTFDTFNKEKESEEPEVRPRNGLNRGKSEPWYKGEEEHPPPMTARERIDRAKSWRDRDKEAETSEPRANERTSERANERTNERQYERRWDRDQGRRVEKEPEWFDEPAEDKASGHTEEDFKKFMESMKASRNVPSHDDKAAAISAAEAAIEAARPAVVSAPALEAGPDKFFMAFASNSGLDVGGSSAPDAKKDTSNKGKSGAKSSRFTSFFHTPQEDIGRRLQTEPPTPLAGPPPPNGNGMSPPPDAGEKEAFQALLMKLQRQTFQTNPTPPAPQAFQQPPPPQDAPMKNAIISPEPYHQYGAERRDDPRMRHPQPPMHEILAPRPMMPAQPPQLRQDQLLQELVGQRHHAPSQGSGRIESNPGRNTSNTEFLMNLMRAAPEPPRAEQLHMRMPQPQRTAQIPHPQEREPEFPREARGSQRQMRSQPPPGFMDEPMYHPEQDHGPQPTQILRRPPPPPGLDQMNPNWMPGGGPIPPQRSMIPPPGLAGGPNRNMPMPGMFPPNFPPGGFPPPDSMVGPPRNMQPPPGFFGGPPPPGFIPPPGMGGYQGLPGPDSHGFGSPFDGRGMPPPGAAQAFRRQ